MTSAVMAVARVPAKGTLGTGMGDSVKSDSFYIKTESESITTVARISGFPLSTCSSKWWISSCGIPSTIIIDRVDRVKVWLARLVDDSLNYNSD
jgi:hypothetical protein